MSLRVDAVGLGMAVAFGGVSAAVRARGTHARGIALAGTVTIGPDPALPESVFFAPGRVFPARLRHASVRIGDDAARDARGAALKLSDQATASPFDLPVNSGDGSPFYDVPSFLAFMRASTGPEAMKAFAAAYPKVLRPACDGSFRAPDSYASLVYAAGVTYVWTPRDGSPRLARLRIRPEPLPAPPPLEPDHGEPWDDVRRPEETRPPDYLRLELRDRIARGPVIYAIDAQVRAYTDDPDPYDCTLAWEALWLPLARVELHRVLDHASAERLRFRVDALPPELVLPDATHPEDPRSIGRLRQWIYGGGSIGRALATLSPRRRMPRVLGPLDRVDHIEVHGRLVHDDADGAPVHHAGVELWDRGARHAPLARGRTDAAGRFVFAWAQPLGGPSDGAELRLVVLAHPGVGGRLLTLGGPRNFHGPRYDFGAIRVAWFEYDHTLGLPRADRLRPLSQGFDRRYWPALLRANLPHILVNRAHRALLRLDEGLLSLDRVQRAYPPTLTTLTDRADPGASRGDRWLGLRVLNGFNPWNFRVYPDGGYRLTINWDDFESTGLHDLVNVEARFEVAGDWLLPRWIRLAWRQAGHTAAGSSTTPPRTYTPADGEAWASARRVLRVQVCIAGELDTHLCQAHLNVEQYAMAAWRNLVRSPLTEVLLPHLREVSAINRRGDDAVFGPDGVIPTSSALTTHSALGRMRRQLGRLDWTGWRPRAPICATHTYARAANLYWEALTEHFAHVFASRRAELVAHWIEVRRFSDDLVGHSVPWVPLPDWTAHADLAEIDDPRIPREHVGGVVRAVRPITRADTPQEGDLERLEQACRYIVFHATFYHTWENDAQRDDGGELAYATLGLRNGSFGPETDPTIGPTPRQATDQLYFAHTLAMATPGFLLANEYGDVPRSLIDALVSRRDAFAALAFPIERVRSRVNI